VEVRGVSGPRMGRCDGWVWLGWRYQGFAGMARVARSFLET